MYNTTSNFPNDIDELLFISDCDLLHKDIIATHQTFIDSKEYTNASEYIDQQEGITPVNAGLFNCIRNRIISLQTYLTNTEKINPMVLSDEEPTDDNIKIWI